MVKLCPSYYIGHKIGLLTVVDFIRSEIAITSRRNVYKYYFLCNCICGNQTEAELRSITGSGKKVSCGCVPRSKIAKGNFRHGDTLNGKLTSEYHTWQSMIKRCNNEKDSNYHIYGGSGISVCDRWLGKKGFTNFLEDMGRKPNRGLSIDRIDGAKGYYPENCRWATSEEQANNTNVNIKVTWEGEQYTIRQLMNHLGLNGRRTKYYQRLVRGWSVKKTFTAP